MTGPTVGLATRTERRRLVASAVPATVWMAGSVVVSLIVELIFFRPSWFFLDDIRNLAEARQRGLTWGYLTSPIGEHLTPGHRLLDWVVAVPLGGHWGAALTLELAFCAVALSYLARTLCLMYGEKARNAIPVLLAGTAWPLLGTGQWLAGGALAIPVCAAISGALYHHLRWRADGRRKDAVCVVVWTGHDDHGRESGPPPTTVRTMPRTAARRVTAGRSTRAQPAAAPPAPSSGMSRRR